MSIKQAQYNIKGTNGYDVYHYETNNDQVKVLDENKNVLGTMKEFAQEGRVITSGKVTDLKISGIYKIKNVTGLPSEVDVSKIAILEITAVGSTNNPEMILYKLTTDNGTIYSKTVNPGKYSTEWSLGGVKVQNLLNGLDSSVGTLSNLKTTAKSNLVNSVNEAYDKAVKTEGILSSLSSNFSGYKTHNHDDRYIQSSGGSLNGDLLVKLGSGLKVKNANGKTVNLLTQSDYQTYELGNSDSVLNLRSSKTLLHNGRKVWTEDNDGHYSGLDADTLDSHHAGDFAKIESSNTFKLKQRFDQGLSTRTTIDFDNGLFSLNQAGDFVFKSSPNSREVKITSQSNLIGLSDLTFDTGLANSEGRLVWKIKDDVMGFLRNPAYNNGNEIWFYHWSDKKNGRIFTINGTDHSVHFDNEIHISGKRLYLQPTTPTGTGIPVGSIWIS